MTESYANLEERIRVRNESPDYQGFEKQYKVDNPYHTYLMEWDVDCCIWYWDPKEETSLPIDWDDNLVYLEPENEKTEKFVELPGLAEWIRKPLSAVSATPDGEDILFDWKSWNGRGIELAKKLRELLPDDYVLYYCPPFEDYSSWDAVPVLITKKGD